MKQNLNKISTGICALGLLSLIAVIFTKSAYPDPLFLVLAPVGILLLFISAGLFLLDWILDIRKGIKQKNYLYAGLLTVLGVGIIALCFLN